VTGVWVVPTQILITCEMAWYQHLSLEGPLFRLSVSGAIPRGSDYFRAELTLCLGSSYV